MFGTNSSRLTRCAVQGRIVSATYARIARSNSIANSACAASISSRCAREARLPCTIRYAEKAVANATTIKTNLAPMLRISKILPGGEARSAAAVECGAPSACSAAPMPRRALLPRARVASPPFPSQLLHTKWLAARPCLPAPCREPIRARFCRLLRPQRFYRSIGDCPKRPQAAIAAHRPHPPMSCDERIRPATMEELNLPRSPRSSRRESSHAKFLLPV